MGIRKQDLYDFIETKTSKTKNGLNVQINNILVLVKDAAKQEFKGLDNISRYLKNASDSMEVVREDHKEILRDHYFSNNKVSDCNRAITYGDAVIGRLYEVAKTNLDNVSTNAVLLDSKYPKLFTVVNGVRKEYEAINDKLRDVEILELELKGIIKGSRSGKDAYKNLVALNVNMSGFEDAQTTLPAVQKLSVDVCVINEDCKDGE